ncbi:beta-N-acetylhexosaminidase [Paenibacillus segetis]|uniref:Glycoside hydrolase family 20 n=1 Tax=Paenibacillus segetis TaxID=1325360 RepID=A0ABQ1YSN1_9BACL|nr:beta-N-acetylhexosaminidase [Paenibacillus segetis]GGH37283.1 glycoside hydrolase family 20 [Paenibacillus segetis]
MKIHLNGVTQEISQGVAQLADMLGFQLHPEGISVEVIQEEGPLQVSLHEGQGRIQYQNKIHFYRALGLFVEHAKEGDSFEVTETPRFDFNGTMLDVSRNGVMKVDTIKQFIRYMAVMGLNGLMIYTEDTYEIEELPYFGYMRGRYTVEELRDCDDYADMFGIEMIPCIQTLGHLPHALKWDYASQIKDHNDILLPGEPKTYEFIEQMIGTAAKTFRSKRIHIGMDEAFQVGLGRYLREHGFRDRFEIMNEHVSKVLEITNKYELHPMIWSDMYFNLLANDYQGHLYNPNADFSDENMDKIPEGVQFVYWDYGKGDEASYEKIYDMHLKFGSLPIFAGGIHMWNSIVPNYGKTWTISHPALRAAKNKGLKEVFSTAWGDNGNETNHLVILAGLQLFAEHGYGDEVDDEHLAKRLKACTGLDLFEPLVSLKYMDEVPGVDEGNHWMANTSKFLLWQDLMIGLLDGHIEPDTEAMLPGYYADMEKKWRACKETMPAPFHELFASYEKLAAVLSMKSTLGVRIKRYYDAKQTMQLNSIVSNELPQLISLVEELRLAHRKIWMLTYKAFGWEVLDIRYGGLKARIQSAGDRILDYVEGRVSTLEELDAERLIFDQNGVPTAPLNVNATYQSIVTANALT